MDHTPPPAIVESTDWLARAEALNRELEGKYVVSKPFDLNSLFIRCFGSIYEEGEKEKE